MWAPSHPLPQTPVQITLKRTAFDLRDLLVSQVSGPTATVIPVALHYRTPLRCITFSRIWMCVAGEIVLQPLKGPKSTYRFNS